MLGLVGLRASKHVTTASGYQLPPPTSSARPPDPGRPVARLGDNPLFAVSGGTTAVTCTLPAYHNDPAGMESFLRAALPCLDQAWAPVLQRAGEPFRSPEIAFPTGDTWSSPCGSVSKADHVAAFYCPPDNTLYMPFRGLQPEDIGDHVGAYLAVFAHEYGHHVQNLSGLTHLAQQMVYDASPQSARGLELTRRIELEANCFSGMFFSAVAGHGSADDSVVTDGRLRYTAAGDPPGQPPDHGNDEHRLGWWMQGLRDNTVARCNTWQASADDVR